MEVQVTTVESWSTQQGSREMFLLREENLIGELEFFQPG